MHPNDWFWFYVLMLLLTTYNGSKIMASGYAGVGLQVVMIFAILLQIFFLFAYGVDYPKA